MPSIEHLDGAVAVVLALLLHALPVILKVRLAAHQRVHQFLFFVLQLLNLLVQRSSRFGNLVASCPRRPDQTSSASTGEAGPPEKATLGSSLSLTLFFVV